MPTETRGPATGPNRHSERPNGPSRDRSHPARNPWTAFEQAWRSAQQRLPEIREDVSTFANVQVDRARLAVRGLVTRTLWLLLALVTLTVVFAIAAARLLDGIAGGAGVALGGNVWLANLLTGAATILALLAAARLHGRRQLRRDLRKLQRRYARRAERPAAGTVATSNPPSAGGDPHAPGL